MANQEKDEELMALIAKYAHVAPATDEEVTPGFAVLNVATASRIEEQVPAAATTNLVQKRRKDSTIQTKQASKSKPEKVEMRKKQDSKPKRASSALKTTTQRKLQAQEFRNDRFKVVKPKETETEKEEQHQEEALESFEEQLARVHEFLQCENRVMNFWALEKARGLSRKESMDKRPEFKRLETLDHHDAEFSDKACKMVLKEMKESKAAFKLQRCLRLLAARAKLYNLRREKKENGASRILQQAFSRFVDKKQETDRYHAAVAIQIMARTFLLRKKENPETFDAPAPESDEILEEDTPRVLSWDEIAAMNNQIESELNRRVEKVYGRVENLSSTVHRVQKRLK